MNTNTLKQSAADAALQWLLPRLEGDAVLGIGTGSTVNYFIDVLAHHRHQFDGCVASSEQSAKRLQAHGIPVHDLNTVSSLPFYIDSADEVSEHLHMIKGGGAALTREKIVAAAADIFICIVDESKLVPVLGQFPLPIEVIPMARSYVARELVKLGGNPAYRKAIITDNGNVILDVRNLAITDPIAIETQINQITGVVANGLFAVRSADILLLATTHNGVTLLTHE